MHRSKKVIKKKQRVNIAARLEGSESRNELLTASNQSFAIS